MKVVQLCSYCGYGSVGKICQALSECLTKKGIENYVLYSRKNSNYPLAYRYSKHSSAKLQSLKSRILGNYGFNSEHDTYRLINKFEEIEPDIVHIHNIHSHDCNIEVLFDYFRMKKTKIFYTFHDCWAFTGYCMYFDTVGCEKWKTQCEKCPLHKKFSWIFDRSKELYERKKALFSELDLTIITPSAWLSMLTKESFLGNYPIKVINNGINLSVFKPYDSNFRGNYNLKDKFIILGVAMTWEDRKGLNTFVKLAKDLDDHFQIVMVGTNETDDKKLPDNIISIHRTKSQKELAEIYSAADIFVNPTMEENFPTVNIESIACGTPVITYDTGGSKEMLDDKCGIVVPRGDYKSLLLTISSYAKTNKILKSDCVERAKMYNQDDKYLEYLAIYNL